MMFFSFFSNITTPHTQTHKHPHTRTYPIPALITSTATTPYFYHRHNHQARHQTDSHSRHSIPSPQAASINSPDSITPIPTLHQIQIFTTTLFSPTCRILASHQYLPQPKFHVILSSSPIKLRIIMHLHWSRPSIPVWLPAR